LSGHRAAIFTSPFGDANNASLRDLSGHIALSRFVTTCLSNNGCETIQNTANSRPMSRQSDAALQSDGKLTVKVMGKDVPLVLTDSTKNEHHHRAAAYGTVAWRETRCTSIQLAGETDPGTICCREVSGKAKMIDMLQIALVTKRKGTGRLAKAGEAGRSRQDCESDEKAHGQWAE
jgi:hypothetical protein